MSIVNGISRIGYMKGGKSALWEDEHIADSITAHAVQFIEENKGRPFFLYFGRTMFMFRVIPIRVFGGRPTWDFAAMPSCSSTGRLARSSKPWKGQGFVKHVDYRHERQRSGCRRRLCRSGGREAEDHKPWGPFRGGKYSAYEAGTRVPFIVNWQGKTRAKESSALVSQIDMPATLARLAGVDITVKEVGDSRDQLDAWLGHDEKGRDYVIGAASTLTVLTRHWKYIEPQDGSSYNPFTNTELGNDPQDQLYDIVHDRGEYDNVAAGNPLVVRFMKEILRKRSQGIGMEL